MVDLVEDEQGICPGPFGTLGVTRAELNVAEVIERVGLVESEADVNPCLADPVGDCLKLPQGVLEVRVRVVEAA
jgi:hypothetical protein